MIVAASVLRRILRLHLSPAGNGGPLVMSAMHTGGRSGMTSAVYLLPWFRMFLHCLVLNLEGEHSLLL